jgi:hypothetical protein
MTFLETLKANLGGLIRLKTSLYWYDYNCWDGNSGRICLILDATEKQQIEASAAQPGVVGGRLDGSASVFLIIDGSPKWVWIDEQNIEILTSEPA